MKTQKLFLILVVSILLISGCGGNQRPDDVREEIWYNGEKVYSYLVKGMDGEKLSLEEDLQRKQFCDQYGKYMFSSPEYTEKESKFIGAIWFMNLAYTRHALAVINKDVQEQEDALSAFRENENIYKEIHGL